MILNTKGYAYNDLTIVPAEISNISSRTQCDPYIVDNKLPIFTAPMASVVNDINYNIFLQNKITPIIPRNIDIKTRILLMNKEIWVALSLNEFTDLFINNYKDRIDECCNHYYNHYYICVDIANGHMKSLYEACFYAKKLAIQNNYELRIMTGNIANPETYKWICKFNETCKHKVIDYIRIGIGSGAGCITSSNTSIHYPMASLIDECYNITKRFMRAETPYIIADGGIRNYSDVIKALALGADFVMVGSLFSQCIESAGDKYSMNQLNKIDMRFNYNAWEENSLRINENGEWFGHIKELKDEKYIGKLNVKFFGMASADGQKSISGKKTKTSEGITKYLPVKYTLRGWTENMISYLRSAMSYTNCTRLEYFIGKQTLIPNSISEIQSVNK